MIEIIEMLEKDNTLININYVGEWPCVEVGDSGTETGDAQVGEWTRVVAMENIRKAGRAR